jgi:uncharacterized protein
VSNVDVILKMYEYFGTGQLDRIRTELMTPDITWTMPGHHPLAGSHHGGAQAMAFLGNVAKAGIEFDQIHFGELDDGTVVERHLGHAKLDTEAILLPACTTYRIENGQIAEVNVHSGDQHALDRYMWAVAALKPVPDRLADDD